jgi:hypothetical protein
MPAIYLTHPVHGAKVATMEAEAIYDEASGWMRYDPDTQSSDAAVPANELVVKRRGRRPAVKDALDDDGERSD